MIINFCDSDGGEVIFTKNSEDIRDILNIVTQKGAEINFYVEKDNFFHGYVESVMYQIDETERNENLSIYMSQDYVKSDVRLILDKVNEINENM